MEQLTDLDESVETETSHRISRRTLVKGGLVAGTALWAVPAVQVLGMGKAFAATASTGSGNAPSYVMLVLSNGNGVYFSVKVGQDGSASCVSSPNNGNGGSALLQNQAFSTYVSGNGWTLSEALCGTNLHVTATVSGGLQVTIAPGYSLVGFMIHDGSLPGNGSTSQTATPGDSSLAGWTVPALGSTGTVIFAKP